MSVTKPLRDLYKMFIELASVEECERLFEDLCTPGELKALSDRWQVAKLLDRELPYREIYERTGVSTATVTRVARALVHGSNGYRCMLDRLSDKDKR